jgi:hypothetical protein
MGPDDDARCTNQVWVRDEREAQPSTVCACTAGLIHMHDCPVALGLECQLFVPREDDAGSIEAREFEDVHGELMDAYMTRAYFHRVRSLAPVPDAWQRRQDGIGEVYAGVEVEPDDAPDEPSEAYERERARLLEIRRKKEEQRHAREEEERKAKEARVKANMERLARQVARRAEAKAKSKARRQPPAGDEPAAAGSGTGEGPPKRRRRRRKKPAAQGPAPAAGAPPAPQQGGDAKPKRRRRRRRRGKKNQSGDAPA